MKAMPYLRYLGAFSAPLATLGARLCILVLASSTAVTQAQEDAGCVPPKGACPSYRCAKQAFFGDLHVHTSYSLDSYVAANRNTPADAYAFARSGAELAIAAGDESANTSTRLSAPLDFVAVTDHAEFLAPTGLCLLTDSDGHPLEDGSPLCATLRNQGSAAQLALAVQAIGQNLRPNPGELAMCQGQQGACELAEQNAWVQLQRAASAANVPCDFTAFKAYEWTAQTGGANLHRNVIFAGENVPEQVYDYLDYPTPLSLWQALERGCKPADGCNVVTIPHNSNYSRGSMWDTGDDPAALDYMERYQVAMEIYQHKGASECLPGQAFSDAKCDFEIVEGGLLSDLLELPGEIDLVPASVRAQGYLRNALARGLTQLVATGRNPLELGIVASTDTHNGTPGKVEEDDWPGHAGNREDTPDKRLDGNIAYSPGGLTGVWAEENTRAAIFAAIRRREVFGTSGPRIPVRFYALQGVAQAEVGALCSDTLDDLPSNGAVPMGSNRVTFASAPTFIVSALRDGRDLAEIEIIKMAVDRSGQVVSSSHRRALTAQEGAAPCISWQDTSFDPTLPALYYARILETPSPRWSSYDCARVPGQAACQPGTDLPQLVQERAWTSPIYFRP